MRSVLLVELAAAVYLMSVLWPYAKRLHQWRPKFRVGLFTALVALWAVLWLAHLALTAAR